MHHDHADINYLDEEVLKEKNSEDKVSAPKKTEITYDELLAFVELEKKFLFDVRDATEIKGTGTIPSAINIPCELIQLNYYMKGHAIYKSLTYFFPLQ